jgi:predicted nucleic acid-binding protein
VDGYLIDTNVISEFAKPAPSNSVRVWFENAAPDTLFASVITIGEIRIGVENLPPGRRRTELESWLQSGLPGWFASNLLSVTPAIADRWGRLSVLARSQGMILSTADGLIASTAIENDLTLVTRNVKDFVDLGIDTLNPWN